MSVAVLLVFAVVTAGGEAWAKNWNLDKQENEKIALASYSDVRLCMFATDRGNWEQRLSHEKYVREAKRRGLNCGVGGTENTQITLSTNNPDLSFDFSHGSWCIRNYLKLVYWIQDKQCLAFSNKVRIEVLSSYFKTGAANLSHTCRATFGKKNKENLPYFHLRDELGLDCSAVTSISKNNTVAATAESKGNYANYTNDRLCADATVSEGYGSQMVYRWETSKVRQGHVQEAKRRGLTCGTGYEVSSGQRGSISENNRFNLSKTPDFSICLMATNKANGKYSWQPSRSSGIDMSLYVQEAKRRGLSCGVGEATQTASASSANSAPKTKTKVTSAQLTASQKEAERLREELAALKAKQSKATAAAKNDILRHQATHGDHRQC